MDTLNKLLDKSREMCGSDLATAARLRVTRSAVSKWRHGGKIEAAHLARLIDLTQQDPAVAVQVMAEQEATPEERRMWETVWDRLSPVTSTVAGALLLAVLLAPWPAQAATTTASADYAAVPIMSRLRRFLRTLWPQPVAA